MSGLWSYRGEQRSHTTVLSALVTVSDAYYAPESLGLDLDAVGGNSSATCGCIDGLCMCACGADNSSYSEWMDRMRESHEGIATGQFDDLHGCPASLTQHGPVQFSGPPRLHIPQAPTTDRAISSKLPLRQLTPNIKEAREPVPKRQLVAAKLHSSPHLGTSVRRLVPQEALRPPPLGQQCSRGRSVPKATSQSSGTSSSVALAGVPQRRAVSRSVSSYRDPLAHTQSTASQRDVCRVPDPRRSVHHRDLSLRLSSASERVVPPSLIPSRARDARLAAAQAHSDYLASCDRIAESFRLRSVQRAALIRWLGALNKRRVLVARLRLIHMKSVFVRWAQLVVHKRHVCFALQRCEALAKFVTVRHAFGRWMVFSHERGRLREMSRKAYLQRIFLLMRTKCANRASARESRFNEAIVVNASVADSHYQRRLLRRCIAQMLLRLDACRRVRFRTAMLARAREILGE